MPLLSSDLMVYAVPSMRWASVTVLPSCRTRGRERHPCALWANLPPGPVGTRVPHTPHIRERYDPMPQPNVLLLRLLATTPRTELCRSSPSFSSSCSAVQFIDTGGPHGPLGLPPPENPGRAAIGPTHPHRNHFFRPAARSTYLNLLPFPSLTLRYRFKLFASTSTKRRRPLLRPALA